MSPLNDTFKALSDSTRREILHLLAQGDLTAGAIAECFDMSKPSVSHHLSALKQAGLVLDERRGQNIIYSLNTTVFQDVLGWVMQLKQSETKTSGKANQADAGSTRTASNRRKRP